MTRSERVVSGGAGCDEILVWDRLICWRDLALTERLRGRGKVDVAIDFGLHSRAMDWARPDPNDSEGRVHLLFCFAFYSFSS